MKKLIYIICALVLTVLTGCKKFSYFQNNPNETTQATPDLLLNTVEQTAFQVINVGVAEACRQLIFSDDVNTNQDYGWQRAGFDQYNSLRQVLKMEQEAARLNKPEYIPLVKFFKAYYFMQLTLTFGDIPYKEALLGDSNLYKPLYDPQQDIFLSVLDDLKEANALITSGTASVQGDIIYNGNMQQWKQLINSFSLRILMSLSAKENNTTLGVKQRFAEIVNDPSTYPLFTGNSDNGQLMFYDLKNNRYPYFNDNDMHTTIYMEETFVNLLKSLNDVRLFSYADKAPEHANLPADDFNAYGGVMGSATVSENNARVIAGEASKVNPRYYSDPVNEPSVAMGYAELQFILAEGVVRGWISGNAADYYNNGILASFAFYNIDPTTANAYIQQPAVQLSVSDPLKSILTQKYLASFMNNGWQTFYEQRRTGIPVFDVSGDGVVNNKMVPKRWMYPETELQLNTQNVSDAIARQFPGGDDVNAVMWLLKPE